MMRSYVCQQCRLNIHRRLALPRHPHLHSTRTIVSFRKTPITPRSETEAQRPSEEPIDERDAAQEQPNTDSEKYRFRITKHDNRGRVPKPRDQDSSPASTFRQQHVRPGHTPLNGNKNTSNAQKISDLLAARTGPAVEEAWNLFKETYTSRDVPALTNPSFSDLNHLMGGKVFLDLANSICREYSKGHAELPTPTEVLFRYEQVQITPANAWKRTIANMTYEFLQSLSKKERSEAAGSAPSEKRSTEDVMAELLSVWKFFFQRNGAQEAGGVPESIAAEWTNVPETEVTFNAGKTFGSRLQQFHPLHHTSPELQFSALVIFSHFFAEHQSASATLDALRVQNKPFLDLLTSTLAGADILQAFTHLKGDPRMSSNFHENFRRSLVTQLEQAPTIAWKINGLDVATAAPEEKASHMVEFFTKRISKEVLMKANSSQLEKLWVEVETHYKTPDGNVQIPAELYNAFLKGFMTLFKPDHTVRVWNHMIAHNVVPDMETWLAMLVGCAKAKDLAGLNAVWQRMLNAGLEPDLRCWTTRIHALISCREVNAGMTALDDMGKRWLSAEQMIKNPPAKGSRNLPSNSKMVNNCTKPGTGVINGAVTAIVGLPTKGKVQTRKSEGMAHQKKVEFVHKILQWAGNFDIKPDVRTYNALISLYLDSNDYITAFKLLRQMEKEGMEGDLSTHSMLLRAAFDNDRFDSLSHKEQATRIINLFLELEQGGLKPNNYLFDMAIDRLLKNYSNMAGVRTIMEHMVNRGFHPGPKTFTSLVTHYLQQSPPAIKDLDSLVARIFGPPAQPTDMYLFDRIIEGYARNDEVASAMTVLTKMSGQGKRPSFRALSEIVRAMYRAGKWERARSIVRDVERGEGVATTAPMTTHNVGRKEFFKVIDTFCPELLQEFAGDYLRSPVNNGHASTLRADYDGQATTDVGSAFEFEELYDQTQESYEEHTSEEYQPSDQAYDQGAYEQASYGGAEQAPYRQGTYDHWLYEQAQTRNQHISDMDDEFVNAEHAGYLSDKPETPQQLWRHNDPAESDGSSSNQRQKTHKP